MLKNKTLMLAVALLILILGVGYHETRPKPVNKDKIKGTIYVMPAPFLLNLADGKFAKITVALELAPGQSDGASATAAGTLPEEPLVREIVTNAVTNQNGEALVSDQGRAVIKRQILKAIDAQTD